MNERNKRTGRRFEVGRLNLDTGWEWERTRAW